jgi:hypothetical protein
MIENNSNAEEWVSKDKAEFRESFSKLLELVC